MSYNTSKIQFKQSLRDFPLTVNLDRKNPSWGLSRWKENQCLRFVPFDDEGFSLRGDRRQLLYKGRGRSHRFTILGDGAFEYDCILLKEPESNVISLRMEGAENFDFFRQPDFVPDPFLKGSYAVYLKDTFVGQGTGKLCHIHRPLIIDARGRKCWGALAVAGNELRITIPENWLADAKYPVVVDPTIGTTAVGSQYLVEYDPPDDPWTSLMFEVEIVVNRFLVSEAINGACTAYFYANEDDSDAGGRGVIYSNNYNQPHLRKTKNENWINLRVTSGNPKGWRSGTFQTDGNIASGSYIWFGCFCEYFWFPRFDYGGTIYSDWWDGSGGVPNTFPGYSGTQKTLNTNGYKLSMYFTYTAAQNYVRTLTQSVKVIDSRKTSQEFKRTASQSVNGSTVNKHTAEYKRLLPQEVCGDGDGKGFVSFFRQCLITVANSTRLSRLPSFLRSVFDNADNSDGIENNRELTRNCDETVEANSEVNKNQEFYRIVDDDVMGGDVSSFPVLFVRYVQDTQGVSDTLHKWGDYIRGLFFEAGNLAETAHKAEYYRTENETVQAEGSLFRQLMIFIKLVSGSLVRDFILRRFLIAREELTLKSCITKELILESKIC